MMLGWIIFVLVLLLWTVVAVWRAVVFVGEDMLESWRNNEEYDNQLFGEAIRAGLLQGIGWPVTAPVKALGSLFYRWAFSYADSRYRAADGKLDPPELDITGELEKIEPEPIPESRAQARLRAEAEAARQEYEAKRLSDETAVGQIPAYTGRHTDE